jgi:hypothetical protein
VTSRVTHSVRKQPRGGTHSRTSRKPPRGQPVDQERKKACRVNRATPKPWREIGVQRENPDVVSISHRQPSRAKRWRNRAFSRRQNCWRKIVWNPTGAGKETGIQHSLAGVHSRPTDEGGITELTRYLDAKEMPHTGLNGRLGHIPSPYPGWSSGDWREEASERSTSPTWLRR